MNENNMLDKDDKEVQQLVAQVPWGHNIILMEKIKDKKARKIYSKRYIRKITY